MKKLLAILIICMSTCSVLAQETLQSYEYKLVDFIYEEKYNEALTQANMAISKYPNEAKLYYYRGQAQYELGNKQAALADFDKAIQLNPKDDDVYFYRGALKKDMNSPQSAYKDLSTCIQINPKNPHCYSIRALVRMKLGDMNGFKSDMDKANLYLDELHNKIMEQVKEQ